MANKLVKVCDIDGKPAVGRITIDVCQDHQHLDRGGLSRNPSSRRRRPAAKIKCEFCGRMFAPQGLKRHIQAAHADSNAKEEGAEAVETASTP